ncbi:MAG: 16S rRNA processing protein RimM [Acidobacteria bacterium]|nr:MAG: 16S rRNA processing protein RimM [Acidobacteriota bacterium]
MNEKTSSSIVVAKIVKAHGIRGELVLESFTDVEGRLENEPVFWLVDQGKAIRRLQVESRRSIRGRQVIKFVGLDTRSEAEQLRGKELGIPESETGPLPADHFFIHQLIGLNVFLKNGTEIGRVKNVMKTGGVDLLEVGDKGEFLIPFAEEICIEIDLEKSRITINPPEGLLQVNAR